MKMTIDLPDIFQPEAVNNTNTKQYQNLIFNNVEQSLGLIPFHSDLSQIKRFAPLNFPFHVAIHHISELEELPPNHIVPHAHHVAEIEILIPDAIGLEYEIQLGDEIYHVSGHSTIWIPPGLSHAANIKRGSGYFICMILDSTENLFKSSK